MPHILVDGDQILFKGAAACEEEIQWDDQNHVLYSNATRTFRNVLAMIDRLFTRFDTHEHTICFSGTQPYFRTLLAPDYKAGRSRKPLCYAAVKERIEGNYNCKEVPGLEADDVMGILATKPGDEKRIIVSQDKDMKTIPATVWNGEHLITYSADEADYWHLYQTLVGDKCDGYPGCPGVGPVKAAKLLQAAPSDGVIYAGPEAVRAEYWRRVAESYKKAGLTEADALVQARLARILRWSDWDNKKGKPILWSPATQAE